MIRDGEPFKIVYYYDSGSIYNPVKSSMVDFMNGNPNPMIIEINQESYNHFKMEISSKSNTSTETIDSYADSLATLIGQTPSITHFYLTLDINSSQAANLFVNIKDSNIYELTLCSNKWTSEGMADFLNSLSDSKVQDFIITGHLSDDAISGMSFIGTPFETVIFDEIHASDAGLVQLFQSFYGSNVTNFALYIQDTFSAETAKQIDFSQTNFNSVEFYGINFEPGAVANLSFEGSHINSLDIERSLLCGDDLKALSENLHGSEITKLILGLDYSIGTGDLAQLQLAGTPVEYLSITYGTGIYNGFGDELAQLDLTNTQVTTLKLQGEITDQNLPLLNLHGTSVEHLILYGNQISQSGINAFMQNIKGTSVKDVSYSLGFYPNQFTVLNEEMSEKDAVLMNDDQNLLVLQLSEVLSYQDNILGCSSCKALPSIDSATVLPIQHVDPLHVVDNMTGWG